MVTYVCVHCGNVVKSGKYCKFCSTAPLRKEGCAEQKKIDEEYNRTHIPCSMCKI